MTLVNARQKVLDRDRYALKSTNKLISSFGQLDHSLILILVKKLSWIQVYDVL